MTGKPDYVMKLVLIGSTGAGKSSLVVRFADDRFRGEHLTTIGVDFKVVTIDMGGKLVKLQIWDTAGQERFRTLGEAYYRGSHGIMVVFDLTDVTSWSDVDGTWLPEIRSHAGDSCSTVLVGNKADLEDRRKVSAEQIEQGKGDFAYHETSAKEGTGVEEAFRALAQMVLDSGLPPSSNGGIILDNTPVNKKKKKGLCNML